MNPYFGYLLIPEDEEIHAALIPSRLQTFSKIVSESEAQEIITEIEKSLKKKEYMSVAAAWLEYTGMPAMVAGGVGAFGINAGFQAGQVRSGTSLFSAARFGFGLALLLETLIGTAIYASILTILDTQDLHAAGLTNEPVGQTLYEHSAERWIVDNPSVPSFWKMLWLSGQ